MRQKGLLERWIRFNSVGAVGVGVQLAVLAGLVRLVEAHYLLATVIAVEAAVLHNFFWHERWTWADRRSGSIVSLVSRAARFHVLNGGISMAGNLTLMCLFTGSMHLDPVASNILSILICSLLNFAAGELLVFRQAAVIALVLVAADSVHAAAADGSRPSSAGEMLAVELRPRTLQAWAVYEQQVDRRYQGAAQGTPPFFALDAFKAHDWRGTAMRGAVAMSRIDRASPGEGEAAVPDGKIHHWAGAIFVPGASVPEVLERLSRLAGNESAHYEEVIGSRLLSRDGDRYRIFMKLRRSKFGVTATYNTEHLVEYRRLSPTRATARSVSTRIAELEHAGTGQEREKTVGSDSGYLWRLNAYWRYETVGNGVLIECESVSLSRSVPVVLRFLVSGMVEGLARESLERTLTGLRTTLVRSTKSGNSSPAT
jgi:putative flippase GtrA